MLPFRLLYKPDQLVTEARQRRRHIVKKTYQDIHDRRHPNKEQIYVRAVRTGSGVRFAHYTYKDYYKETKDEDKNEAR